MGSAPTLLIVSQKPQIVSVSNCTWQDVPSSRRQDSTSSFEATCQKHVFLVDRISVNTAEIMRQSSSNEVKAQHCPLGWDTEHCAGAGVMLITSPRASK